MIQIETIQKIAANSDHVIITQHSMYRMQEKGIRYADVMAAITSGEIIEQYPDDFPNPSCLIFGITISKRILHVVCGTDGEYLWIITAYYPSQEKWELDYKTRRKR